MPSFLSELPGLDYLRYLDYAALLASLNSPYIYGTLIIGAFVMLIAYASFRRHLFHTSISGAGMGFLLGIIITLVIESAAVYKFVGMKRFIAVFSPLSSLPTQTASQSAVLGSTTTSLKAYFSSLPPGDAKALKLSLCQEVLSEIK